MTMLDKMIERIAGITTNAAVETVFGDPMEFRGRTIIPIASVRYGFGMGMGRRRRKGDVEPEPNQSGGGGGGGAIVTPLAVIEIGDGQTRITPIIDVTRLGLAAIALAAWSVFWWSRVRTMEGRAR
jgi:uncharacterized spore protein YtfJ